MSNKPELTNSDTKCLPWVDGLKAFAIIAILLNHLVESFGTGPWFSNPEYNWPEIGTRLLTIFPSDGSLLWRIVRFTGWLGDMGPGVFILLSGFTLTLSALRKNGREIEAGHFYQRRLLRILPIYIVIHILVLICGVFLSHGSINLTSPKVLLSIMGLRFTDGLFFFLNPSWWFIWILIQLYFIFPFLYKYLNHAGLRTFILITLGITLLSRLAGLLDITYSHSLYFWMTGLFFGTRLFEFTAGMVLARLFVDKQFLPDEIKISKLFIFSLLIYLTGFISSLFYYTTLISNILITIGLSGIFLAVWRIIETNLSYLKRPVLWIGMAAFPVFLIHQPFMEWLGAGFSGIYKALVLILIIILAFPVGKFLELSVNRVICKLQDVEFRMVSYFLIFSLSFQFILNLVYFFTQHSLIYRLDFLVSIVNIFFIPFYLIQGDRTTNPPLKIVLFSFLPLSLLFSFILTPNWFSIFWIAVFILFIAILLVSLITKKLLIRLVLPYFLVFVLFGATEWWLIKNHPVEVNRWGEFPALQKDSLTVYSLIPDKRTHLKYNNYDYYVKTNSFGFNAPEINLSKKEPDEFRILIIGDAFTMPEGLGYEDAYPELLKAQLSEKYPDKKIRVYNAGVTGYGPNEMFGQLNKYIDTIKPDLYINQLFINEFDEINLNAEERLQDIGFKKLSRRQRLFGGSQIPMQAIAVSNKIFRTNYYLRDSYSKSLADYYYKQSNLYSDTTISKLRKYLFRVKSLCGSKNCKVIFLYSPGQLEVSVPKDIDYYPGNINLGDSSKYDMGLPGNIFNKLCNEIEIPFRNPVRMLKSNPEQPVYFKKSWHWNKEGHSAISSYLKDYIVESKIIE